MSKLREKMINEFTEDQQRLYVANFYMYLNYHPTNEYPISLDNIWKFMGFANKGNAKSCLTNNFIEGKHYQKVFLPRKKNSNGGRPDETIMLSTNTFKSFCLIAKTKE